MLTIDLNADIGEANSPAWAKAETDILAYVTSVNIACGGHAGNLEMMRKTVSNAHAHGLSIGAHPAYPDRENFGRKSHILGDTIHSDILAASLREQIKALIMIAKDSGAKVSYVKPHGALYNDAVKNADLANLMADIIKAINPALMFMGAPRSPMMQAATRAGLTFIAEGFIDRRYVDDGHLQDRREDGAVIGDPATRLSQAKSLALSQSVVTATGQTLQIEAQSLCLHGDSAGAVETARHVRTELETAGVTIKAFTA